MLTTIKLDNLPKPLPVKAAASASTTSMSDNLLNPLPVKIAVPANTTSESGNPPNPLPAKVALLGNTTTTQDNSIAQSVPSVPPTQAPGTPIANHALQVDFSSTTKI
jgi:hypothetical protein